MPNNAAPDPSEFYKKCFEIENNLTRNILKAIPPGKLDYRPHERSRSTGQIAWTIARGLYARVDMVSPCFSHVIGIPIQPWRKYSGASRIRPVATLHNWTPSRRDMDKVGQLPSGDRIALGGAASDIVWLSTSTRSIIVVRSPRTCGPWARGSHRLTARLATQGSQKGI